MSAVHRTAPAPGPVRPGRTAHGRGSGHDRKKHDAKPAAAAGTTT
ncbi:hypothetical protein ACH4FX_27435 [Streptomyces sp. NPDC018019]